MRVTVGKSSHYQYFMKRDVSMIYLGIDIAKLNCFAPTLFSDSEIILEPFKYSNDYDGFFKLLSRLDSLEQDSFIIGLESTAHYGNNLVEFLVSCNYKVCVLNPIHTSFLHKLTFARPRRIRLILNSSP